LLGYLLLLTWFLYSQAMLTALFAVPALLALNTGLIANSQVNISRDRHLLAQSARMLLQGVPIALILFLLVPRLPGPLWSVSFADSSAVTGISDTMTPGAISRLGQSAEVAFRVQFDAGVPNPESLYWRGPVLSDYQNGRWADASDTSAKPPPVLLRGPPISYTTTLTPHHKRWLFALDLPATEVPGAHLAAGLQLISGHDVKDMYRYHLVSHPSYQIRGTLSAEERKRYLRYPDTGERRLKTLGSDWRASQLSARAIVDKALSLFREQPFVYTLTPPRLDRNPNDRFFFDVRRGFCEHFASSFTLLMRAAGVPARVVTGYQGGESNPLGDYWIVRQSDAHAWSEVWLPGRGWTRVDPTAAVSPERIETGLHAALQDSVPSSLLARREGAWMHHLALFWDAANHGWNEWVLGYDAETQQDLLDALGFEGNLWQALALLLSASVATLALAVWIWPLFKVMRQRQDPVEKTYQQFCRKLARTGIEKGRSEGPRDFASRVCSVRPDMQANVWKISRVYMRLRYGGSTDPVLVRELSYLVRQFRPRRGRSSRHESFWRLR